MVLFLSKGFIGLASIYYDVVVCFGFLKVPWMFFLHNMTNLCVCIINRKSKIIWNTDTSIMYMYTIYLYIINNSWIRWRLLSYCYSLTNSHLLTICSTKHPQHITYIASNYITLAIGLCVQNIMHSCTSVREMSKSANVWNLYIGFSV